MAWLLAKQVRMVMAIGKLGLAALAKVTSEELSRKTVFLLCLPRFQWECQRKWVESRRAPH